MPYYSVRHYRPRVLGLIAVIVLVITLGAGHTGWAGPALAQTVPTRTHTPGGPTPTTVAPTEPATDVPGATEPGPTETVVASPTPGGQATATASAMAATATVGAVGATATTRPGPSSVPPEFSTCGRAPFSQSRGPLASRQTLTVGLGSLTLLSAFGLTGPTAAPTAIISTTIQVVPPTALRPVAAGWVALNCGLQASAVDASGRAITYVPAGILVCIKLPTDAASYANPRLAYYDNAPALVRWVFLKTRIVGNLACTARFRHVATFALFGSEP